MADDRDPLSVEVRRRIFRLIEEFPGLHVREIQRLCEEEYPLVDYHLRVLEARGLVASLEEGGYKRYYPAGPQAGRSYALLEKQVLAALRQSVPRRILLALLEGPLRHRELVGRVGVSKSTASYHLFRLRRAGVLRFLEPTKEHALVDQALVARMLTEHRPHRSGIDSFADAWLDLYRRSHD